MKQCKKFVFRMVAIIIVVFVMTSCSSVQMKNTEKNVTITMSAASSLQDALLEIQKQYNKKQNHVEVTFNFGSSGMLQQQILQGAPVDLYFSAAEEPFQALVKQGLITKQENVLGNELVLIEPKETSGKLKDIQSLKDPNIKKIALGMPNTVPAGTYAKQTLSTLNIWENIESKIVYAKDVRQVLTYVETNNVDAGMVYKTDAKQSDKVKIVESAPSHSHSDIIYPLGVIKTTKHEKEAEDFFAYLQTKEAFAVFQKYGFTVSM